jgi:alkylation response protein AidB-like acyl-CoA dehydrogenase
MTTTSEPRTSDALGAVQSVLPVLQKYRDDAEAARRQPDAVIEALKDAGLFKLWAPKEYGGHEVDMPVFMQAIETMASVDPSAAWVFANTATGAALVATLPPDSAREIYAGNCNVPIPGSVQPRGRAIPVDGGYRLSGRWPLASGGHFGAWFSPMGMVFEGDHPRMIADGVPDMRIMFVRHSELQIIDTWNSLGMRGTGSTDVALEDVFVPEAMTSSFFIEDPQVSGPLYKAGPLVLFSMVLATVMVGTARQGIDAFVQVAKDKVPTLSQSTLGSRPTVHAELARVEARMQSARSFLFDIANRLTDSLNAGKGIPDDLEASRRLACVNAAEAAREAIDRVFALAGTSPIYSGNTLERCLRDIHTASQHLISSPVWWEKTGQYYFGMGLGMP